MPSKKSTPLHDTVPCFLTDEMKQMIEQYADAVRLAAPSIGDHGLSEDEFWRSGLFHSAIERLRGIQAASTKEKYTFFSWALEELVSSGLVNEYEFTGASDRHDFHVSMADGKVCVFEAKGCLDGNNTNIFQRPANAEEFLVWSLCQNPGSDIRAGVWSGTHTRLGGEIIAEKVHVEALIVWDRLCGGVGRPCPKIAEGRGVEVGGRMVPPPCVYLFPRTIPDPRNNPKPAMLTVAEVSLVSALLHRFGGDERDVTEVHIEARMKGANVERKTTLIRCGRMVRQSRWTKLKRANK